ncbi:hypothetical protein Ahy_A07g036162 isoform E [Arachis hypogaea]|uniref:Uncharacterized protein n=1 Tax=Arachis hypogaea TaxID=3818 RepID=A0A445CFE4_ARAHY|nr:hypothetical protein Ahy_A07g036162 isoform E [Arachis hypogaea]
MGLMSPFLNCFVATSSSSAQVSDYGEGQCSDGSKSSASSSEKPKSKSSKVPIVVSYFPHCPRLIELYSHSTQIKRASSSLCPRAASSLRCTSFFRRCRNRSRLTISLCHPLRRTSSLRRRSCRVYSLVAIIAEPYLPLLSRLLPSSPSSHELPSPPLSSYLLSSLTSATANRRSSSSTGSGITALILIQIGMENHLKVYSSIKRVLGHAPAATIFRTGAVNAASGSAYTEFGNTKTILNHITNYTLSSQESISNKEEWFSHFNLFPWLSAISITMWMSLWCVKRNPPSPLNELKQQGIQEERMQLLVNITGAFRPRVLTALVGVCGAGKTIR